MEDADRVVTSSRRKAWGHAAGPFADVLLQSAEAAQQHLTHPDPRARLGAVLLLRDHWGAPAGFAALCERLAFEDPDTTVRCAALTHLGAEHYETGDARMGRLFAGIVRDEAEPRVLRYVAYLGLYALDGCRGPEPDGRTFRIPEDVDWSLVGRYLG